MKAKDECTGCNVFGNITAEHCLVYLAKYENGGCPCMNCLVKTMCKDTCNTRKEYFNYISKNHLRLVHQAYDERHKTIKNKRGET